MGHGPVQLVVFDLGGVLVRITRSWLEAFERAGVPAPAAWRDADGQPGDAIVDLTRLFQLGQMSEGQMLDRVHAAVGRCSRSQAADALDAWLIEPYPGIEGLFERAAAAGLTTACLSNTNERHWRTLMHLDGRYVPLRRLEYRIASHLIGVAKPDAGAYEAVERQTGVAGRSIVFFDDDRANCQAAVQRGWLAHQIDPVTDTVAQMLGYLADLGAL